MTPIELLDQLTDLIVKDFGPTDEVFPDPLCPHCQIHWALAIIQAFYEVREAEDIATKILDNRPKTH